MDEQVTLGDSYRDVASGFTGTAIGREEYLYSNVEVLVMAETRQEAQDSRWIPEQRLVHEPRPSTGATGFGG